MSSYFTELLKKIKKTNKLIKKSIRISNLQHSPPPKSCHDPMTQLQKAFQQFKRNHYITLEKNNVLKTKEINPA